MLFIFEQEGQYAFTMKDTLIPLDMVWISEEGRIVYIKQDALPCERGSCRNVYPKAEALYVLEVNAGTIKAIGAQVGERVEFYYAPKEGESPLTGTGQ